MHCNNTVTTTSACIGLSHFPNTLPSLVSSRIHYPGNNVPHTIADLHIMAKFFMWLKRFTPLNKATKNPFSGVSRGHTDRRSLPPLPMELAGEWEWGDPSSSPSSALCAPCRGLLTTPYNSAEPAASGVLLWLMETVDARGIPLGSFYFFPTSELCWTTEDE